MSEPTILPLQELRRIRQERAAAQERDDAERAGAKAANEIIEQQESIDWDSFWAMLDKRIWTAIDIAAAERVDKAVADALAPLKARLAALERAQERIDSDDAR
jgi:hypothetical protein